MTKEEKEQVKRYRDDLYRELMKIFAEYPGPYNTEQRAREEAYGMSDEAVMQQLKYWQDPATYAEMLTM